MDITKLSKYNLSLNLDLMGETQVNTSIISEEHFIYIDHTWYNIYVEMKEEKNQEAHNVKVRI